MIKADALTRKYGDLVAVDKVSFEIGPREIVGLLGHNGAGKTTIMKMVTGYLEPSAGEVTVNGLDSYRDRLKIQEQVGYLPENCPLYPELSVFEYLDYAVALRGVPVDKRLERIEYAVEKTKLSKVALQPIHTLSRGYRQRLGVAQAILNSPSILILDEPTNGLDPSQILEMRSLIRELSDTATVVISTHILQEVQAVCGRVIIINGGRVALDREIGRLQATGRMFVATDSAPETCRGIFEDECRLKLIDHLIKDGQHHYVLGLTDSSQADSAAAVARALVGHQVNIYAIQPIIRDLETIFGEITAAGKPEFESKDGSKGDVDDKVDANLVEDSTSVISSSETSASEVSASEVSLAETATTGVSPPEVLPAASTNSSPSPSQLEGAGHSAEGGDNHE